MKVNKDNKSQEREIAGFVRKNFKIATRSSSETDYLNFSYDDFLKEFSKTEDCILNSLKGMIRDAKDYASEKGLRISDKAITSCVIKSMYKEAKPYLRSASAALNISNYLRFMESLKESGVLPSLTLDGHTYFSKIGISKAYNKDSKSLKINPRIIKRYMDLKEGNVELDEEQKLIESLFEDSIVSKEFDKYSNLVVRTRGAVREFHRLRRKTRLKQIRKSI